MPLIPQTTIDAVLNIDIVKILEDEGIQLKRSGANYWCCCPFHGEKTPSFKASPATNLWYCFGCNRGGNGIGLIQELKGLRFDEAVEYLARRNHIDFERREETPEERAASFRREQLFRYNRTAQEYFVSKRTAPAAAAYIKSRNWDEGGHGDRDGDRAASMADRFGIGYAPKSGLRDYLAGHGCADVDLMIAAGLLRRNEDTGSVYEFFRERITFPIYDRTGQIVGFSGRSMLSGEEIKARGIGKYVNTPETELYKKGRQLFGLHQALRKIRTSGTAVLCEGNPDVIRLHQIGVGEAVAPLGTALTREQVAVLKADAKRVVLVGDVDDAGIDAVLKNGRIILEEGITDIRVMRLPGDPEAKKHGGVKVDADAYFQTRRSLEEWNALLAKDTVDYLDHLAENELARSRSESEKAAAIEDICGLLALIDEKVATIYLDKFRKLYKNATTWTKAYNKCKVERERKVSREDGHQDMLEEYGFYVSNHCYIGAGQGEDSKWSNFEMRPVLHIKDEKNGRRIFELINDKGSTATVKFLQSELVSLADFRTRTETAGNFIWMAGQAALITLKKYLYNDTPSATEIRQLGWQKDDRFYAWGNGGFDRDGVFRETDKFGVAKINDKLFYIPGSAIDTADNVSGYKIQRQFQFAVANDVTLRQFATQSVTVFGDNAKVGLCFLFATLFRDIIFPVTRGFPLLNLFGQKGTGKTQLGQILMSFFIPNNDPPNVNGTTKAALGEIVASVSNALVHLDEYKNDLDLERREILKGSFDGTGRNKLSLEDKKSLVVTPVNCGVILSGQEMPTADIALFSRLLFLSFSKSEFNSKERAEFDILRRTADRGLMHLTREILMHRNWFEGSFRESWEAAFEDMGNLIRSYDIEERTLKNWTILPATLRTLQGRLDLPFDYADILAVCSRMCIDQNNKTKQNNELSGFWDTMEVLLGQRQIQSRVNFLIQSFGGPFRIKESAIPYEPIQGKRYLLLNYKSVADKYAIACRQADKRRIPVETLRYYLEQSREFIGTKASVRFLQINTATGYIDENRKIYNVNTAMVFDYDALVQSYDVTLDEMTTASPDDVSGPSAIETPPMPEVEDLPLF